jgi:hypothetical protein
MLHIFCTVVQLSSAHQFCFQIPHKALCGIWKQKYGVQGQVYLTYLWYASAVFVLLLCDPLHRITV